MPCFKGRAIKTRVCNWRSKLPSLEYKVLINEGLSTCINKFNYMQIKETKLKSLNTNTIYILRMWKLDLIVIWEGGNPSYMVHNLLFSKKNHINFWMTWRCMGLAETIIVWITPAANSVKVITELPDQLQDPLPRRVLYQQGNVSRVTVCLVCFRYAVIFTSAEVLRQIGLELNFCCRKSLNDGDKPR